VVSNLASNAVKFTPEGGRIEVHLESRGGLACMRVSDTGIGISGEFLPHVFERFRQADAGATREHGGLGLGLAIVRHIVEAHGGTVRAESAGVGRGSLFEIALPARPEGTEPTGPITPRSGTAATPPAAMSLDGLRLLVVDDDPAIRELLRVALEDRGANVILASSVAEAHEALARSLPDVIVTDIAMPGTDGYSFLEQLRTGGLPQATIPAVALTAYASREDAARALGAGFQAHLAKPVDPELLARTIASLARDSV
jgi:CheY-like chemotaxis protein